MPEESTVPGETSALDRFVESLSLIYLNSYRQFWLSKADYDQGVSATYKILTEAFKEVPEITFTAHDDKVMVNHAILEKALPEVEFFVKHFTSLPVSSFTIKSGISEGDFLKLVEILDARPEEIEELGGFEALLERFGVENVVARKVVVREIAESEVVVRKGSLGEQAAKAREAAEKGAGIGSIVAFLKGDVSGKPAEISEQVREVASDPEKLAKLLLQAAQVREKEADPDKGESLADLIVGSLRRAFRTMKEHKSVRTQKGRAALSKTLILLEKKLVDRMRKIAVEGGEITDADIEGMSEMVNGMVQEIKASGLADEYAKRQSAIETTQKKILKYMKGQSAGDLEDSILHDGLKAHGMGGHEWQELLIRSGAAGSEGQVGEGGEEAGGGPGGGAGEGPAGLSQILEAVQHLDQLLSQVERELESEEGPAPKDKTDELLALLEDVDRQIEALGACSVHNIHEPMALLKTCIEMLRARTFGRLSADQRKVLEIAERNTARVTQFLERLQAAPG